MMQRPCSVSESSSQKSYTYYYVVVGSASSWSSLLTSRLPFLALFCKSNQFLLLVLFVVVVVVPLSVFFCSVLLSPLNLSILHFSFPWALLSPLPSSQLHIFSLNYLKSSRQPEGGKGLKSIWERLKLSFSLDPWRRRCVVCCVRLLVVIARKCWEERFVWIWWEKIRWPLIGRSLILWRISCSKKKELGLCAALPTAMKW